MQTTSLETKDFIKENIIICLHHQAFTISSKAIAEFLKSVALRRTQVTLPHTTEIDNYLLQHNTRLKLPDLQLMRARARVVPSGRVVPNYVCDSSQPASGVGTLRLVEDVLTRLGLLVVDLNGIAERAVGYCVERSAEEQCNIDSVWCIL